MNRPLFPHTADTRQNGVTLLELLLVVGVTSLLFAGIASVTQAWVNTEVATSGGQYLQRVASITDKFVQANWANDGTGLPQTDDAFTLAGTDPKWAGLKTALGEEGLLTGPGNTLRNPLGSPMRISYMIDTTGTDPVHRVAVYTTTPLPNKKIWEASRQGGNYGGVVSSLRGTNLAVGAFDQFNIGTANLVPTGGTFACAATQTDGCLIAVMSHNASTLSGSYLYRNDMGDPKYNTMYTDLLMNGKKVTGVGKVETTDLDVAGAANLGTTTVNGTSTFNGPVTMGGRLTANSGMDVSGDANFSNDVTMNSGTLNVDTLNSNTIQAPTINTQTFNAQNVNMNGGTLTVNDDIDVNGDISATGEVMASTVNAGQINATGNMVVGTMTVQNAMTIDGSVNIPNGSLVSDRMVSDHCTHIYDPTNTKADAQGYMTYGICP